MMMLMAFLDLLENKYLRAIWMGVCIKAQYKTEANRKATENRILRLDGPFSPMLFHHFLCLRCPFAHLLLAY